MTKTRCLNCTEQVFGHLVITAVIAVWFLSWSSAVRAAEPLQYTWSELKVADGKALADYRSGQPVLFCLSYRSKAVCEVATTPPTWMDCLSAHTQQVPGQWIALGDIPRVEAVLGDGKKTCHGRTIPAGQWWGINSGYKSK